MCLLLLVFGGLIGAAGAALGASGVSLRDGTFDAAILTPGIIAATGGLLLIGLGAGLRTLQRIEQTLALRPIRALAGAESAQPPETAETSSEPVRIPLGSKASHEFRPGIALHDILGERSLEGASRLTTSLGSVGDKASPPVPALSAIALAGVHDANAETGPQRFAKNGNGVAGTRAGLRLPPTVPSNLRRTNTGERHGEPAVDALWPKGPRPSRAVEAAHPPSGQSTTFSAIQSQQGVDASKALVRSSVADGAAAGLSVLKSGIVNGMPYTLYSDGSIEAQLPEGMLRFGSITELRNHIEQSA